MLQKAAALLETGPTLVGLSMSPAMESAVRRRVSPPADGLWREHPLGVPVIVDPRMKAAAATAYYDRRTWRKRVKEQQRWDKLRTKKRHDERHS